MCSNSDWASLKCKAIIAHDSPALPARPWWDTYILPAALELHILGQARWCGTRRSSQGSLPSMGGWKKTETFRQVSKITLENENDLQIKQYQKIARQFSFYKKKLSLVGFCKNFVGWPFGDSPLWRLATRKNNLGRLELKIASRSSI